MIIMIMYAAYHNVPGYLPDGDDIPPLFPTTEQAWMYLSDEWDRLVDGFEVPDDVFLGVSTAMHQQGGSTGTVTSLDPGSNPEHDLGIAWCVDAVSVPMIEGTDGGMGPKSRNKINN